MITIKHTRQNGTLVYGAVRGDGVGKILRPFNFRGSEWLPVDEELGDPYWYLPHSRRRRSSWKIDKAREALEEAGFSVEVLIDDITPATGFDDLEAERYERAEFRADRYRAKAASAAATSEAIRADNQQTYDGLAGTPVLVGHYSEKRHRNLLERLWRREGKAWELYGKAKDWRSRAGAAERFRHRREDVGTTQRRIAELEKRLRQIDREMDGAEEVLWDNPSGWPGPLEAQLQERFGGREVPLTVLGATDNPDGSRNVRVHIGLSEHAKAVLAAEVIEITEEIGYWEMVIEASGVKTFTKHNVAKGDFVKVRRRWLEVMKTNARSVTVPDRYRHSDQEIFTWQGLCEAERHPRTGTVGYDEITDLLTGAQAQQRYPAAFAAPLPGDSSSQAPARTTAKRGKVKLEYSGGHTRETWWFTVAGRRYLASWPTPEHQIWSGPPTALDDPAPITVERSLGLSKWEPVTTITVPPGVRWREDVHNALRAWVEPWAAQQTAQAAKDAQAKSQRQRADRSRT